jgi:hypothetical protein
MKLSKNQLKNMIASELRVLGYRKIPIATGAALAFFRPVDDLILSPGIEFSNLYESTFTCSYYISVSFAWGLRSPSTFPARGYLRIGELLEPPERQRLLDPSHAKPGVVDAWWYGFTDDTVAAFLEAFRITEPRFVSQDGLLEEVRNCPLSKDQLTVQAAVEARVVRGLEKLPDTTLRKLKTSGTVPLVWYRAAEDFIKAERPRWLHPQGVKSSAEEAWCLHEFRSGRLAG